MMQWEKRIKKAQTVAVHAFKKNPKNQNDAVGTRAIKKNRRCGCFLGVHPYSGIF